MAPLKKKKKPAAAQPLKKMLHLTKEQQVQAGRILFCWNPLGRPKNAAAAAPPAVQDVSKRQTCLPNSPFCFFFPLCAYTKSAKSIEIRKAPNQSKYVDSLCSLSSTVTPVPPWLEFHCRTTVAQVFHHCLSSTIARVPPLLELSHGSSLCQLMTECACCHSALPLAAC